MRLLQPLRQSPPQRKNDRADDVADDVAGADVTVDAQTNLRSPPAMMMSKPIPNRLRMSMMT
jgi:hypothetical protein